MKNFIINTIFFVATIFMIGTTSAFASPSVEATFEPGSDSTSEVCIMVSEAPDIAQRWIDGTLTTLSGQCTTEDGQTSVIVSNLIPGQTWYFVGLYRDKENHAVLGEWSNELALNIPVKVLTVVPLPTVATDGKTLILELKLQ